jgi:hypothetical protein
MASSTPVEWSPFTVSGGGSPLTEKNTIVKISKDLEKVGVALDKVLKILGVAKSLAQLLEDPLTALITELEAQVKAYLQDKPGVYLSLNWDAVTENVDNAINQIPPHIKVDHNPFEATISAVDTAAVYTKAFLRGMEPFRSINSFQTLFADRLTNARYKPRPIAYNSSVFSVFFAVSAGSPALPAVFDLASLIHLLLGDPLTTYPKVGVQPLYKLKTTLGGKNISSIGTAYTYQQAVKKEDPVSEIGFRVILSPIDAFYDKEVILYTNPEGFIIYEQNIEGIAIPRRVYHLQDPNLNQMLAVETNGEPRPVVTLSDGILSDTWGKVPITPLTPVSDNFIEIKDVFYEPSGAGVTDYTPKAAKIKHPTFDKTTKKITISDWTEDYLYARVYFPGLKHYSSEMIVRNPRPQAYDQIVDLITVSLMMYVYAERNQNDTKAKDFYDFLNNRIPEDLISIAKVYCTESVWLVDGSYGVYSFSDVLKGNEALKNSNKFQAFFTPTHGVAFRDAILEYGDLHRYFNFGNSTKAKRTAAKSILNFSCNPWNLNPDISSYNQTPAMKDFLEEILVLKRLPKQKGVEVWHEAKLDDYAKPLKQMSDRLFRKLKEFAESLKTAGQSLVKFITNLEEWVTLLKSIAAFIKMLIDIIIKIINALKGQVSLLLLPIFGDSAADVAQKLKSATIPPDAVPVATTAEPGQTGLTLQELDSNSYYIGGALVFASGVPSIFVDFLISIFPDIQKSFGTSATDENAAEEEVDL